eukprot:1156596-Pelagomonas_calceolata.AAC.1
MLQECPFISLACQGPRPVSVHVQPGKYQMLQECLYTRLACQGLRRPSACQAPINDHIYHHPGMPSAILMTLLSSRHAKRPLMTISIIQACQGPSRLEMYGAPMST